MSFPRNLVAQLSQVRARTCFEALLFTSGLGVMLPLRFVQKACLDLS
jgi:hypothetical protein